MAKDDTAKKIQAVAGALPDVLTPFSKLAGGTVYRSGPGIIFCIPSPGVLAGGTFTIPHRLGRVPNVCQVLDNLGSYKGDCFFVSRTTSSCVVQFEMAQNPLAVVRIV